MEKAEGIIKHFNLQVTTTGILGGLVRSMLGGSRNSTGLASPQLFQTLEGVWMVFS